MKHIANQSATLSHKLDQLSSIGKMNSVRISKIEATLRGTPPADPGTETEVIRTEHFPSTGEPE
jgi:hypothetical protein